MEQNGKDFLKMMKSMEKEFFILEMKVKVQYKKWGINGYLIIYIYFYVLI